jgi:hypothetical protein
MKAERKIGETKDPSHRLDLSIVIPRGDLRGLRADMQDGGGGAIRVGGIRRKAQHCVAGIHLFPDVFSRVETIKIEGSEKYS